MPRRSSIVLLSVAGHAIALGALVVLSILAPDVLPFPRQLLAAPAMRVVQIPPPPDPPPNPPPPVKPNDGALPPITDAPPLFPPDHIALETAVTRDTDLDRRVNGIEGSTDAIPGSGLGPPESAPPSPPVTRDPVRLHSGIEPPRKIVDRALVYPPIARAAGVQGIVILEVIINERGDVATAKVLRSIAVLDQAALDAVRQWKFAPARLNGDAIPVVMTVTVNFQLR